MFACGGVVTMVLQSFQRLKDSEQCRSCSSPSVVSCKSCRNRSVLELTIYYLKNAQQNILSRSVAICNSSTGNRMHLKVGELTVTCPLSNHISPNGLIPLSSLTVETRTLKDNHECQHGAQQNSFRL